MRELSPRDALPSAIGPGSAADEQTFRDSRRLLVVFGISAAPATLLLGVMGTDFLEGDFGPAGTIVMISAGGFSLVCAGAFVLARRVFTRNGSIQEAIAALWLPPLLTLSLLLVALLAFAMEFSFLLDRS
jgi:hypothetical protein